MNLAGHTVLFGGSFNPPHFGHQMACLYLLEACAADAVWLLPSFRHPFGKQLADFQHRQAMCELLAAAFGVRVRVNDIERTLGSNGRTYDVVTHLRRLHPTAHFALAVGADILGECQTWYRWQDLRELLPLVVIGREGFPAPETPLAIPNVSSSMLRARLERGEGVAGLLPASVERYILEQGLYRPLC